MRIFNRSAVWQWAFAAVVALTSASLPAADEDEVNAASKPRIRQVSTPESAARQFLMAISAQDRTLAEKHCLRRADLDLLFEEPTEAAKASLKQTPIDFSEVELRRLEIGETVRVAPGRTVVLDETWVHDGRKQLAIDQLPLPIDVIRIKGRWLVNPDMFIRGRKDAERLLRLQEELGKEDD